MDTICFQIVGAGGPGMHFENFSYKSYIYESYLGLQELESFAMGLFTKLGSPDPDFYAGGNGAFGPEIATTSFALLCGDEPGEQARDFFYVKEEYRRRGVGTQALKELFKHKSLQVCLIHLFFSWPPY